MKDIYLEHIKNKCLNKSLFVGETVSSKEELDASLRYAKEKVQPISAYFSNPKNVQDFKEKMAALENK